MIPFRNVLLRNKRVLLQNKRVLKSNVCINKYTRILSTYNKKNEDDEDDFIFMFIIGAYMITILNHKRNN